MNYNSLCAVFLLFAAFALNGRAQTGEAAEKQAAIKELVAIVNADNKAEDLVAIFRAQFDNLRDATITSIVEERNDLTPAEKKSLKESFNNQRADMSQRITDKLMEKLNYEEMINEISYILYNKFFTLVEINDLLVFYKTPTGRKTLKMMKPLLSESMALTQERMMPKLPAIIKELEEEEKLEIERRINAKKPRPGKRATK